MFRSVATFSEAPLDFKQLKVLFHLSLQMCFVSEQSEQLSVLQLVDVWHACI